MHHLNHVHRRGAVYVWRRRMPVRQGNKREFVQVSLRTREFSTAKLLAGLLNCHFYDFIMGVQTQVITRAEAQQFLTTVRSKELERIESERYAEPYATTSDEWQNRYLDERARPVALRKFAMMGPVAKLFQEDIAELLRNGVDPKLKPRSIYDHVLSLAHLADCILPHVENNFSSGDSGDLALCIAYHELNEVILGNIPSYTSLTGGTRKMIGVYAEERVRSVPPDEREQIANRLIWMFLGDKHREALQATMDIYARPNEGIFPLFRALDKMDPIVAIWRYLNFYRGKIGQDPSKFNRKMKDFFENPDIKGYMGEHNLDNRLIEATIFLQDRDKAWEYYMDPDSLLNTNRLTCIPAAVLKRAIEGVPLYF